jgi:hypothetical protein
MPEDLTESSKIVMLEEMEDTYWKEHLGVTREEVQHAIGKVGHEAEAAKMRLEKTQFLSNNEVPLVAL